MYFITCIETYPNPFLNLVSINTQTDGPGNPCNLIMCGKCNFSVKLLSQICSSIHVARNAVIVRNGPRNRKCWHRDGYQGRIHWGLVSDWLIDELLIIVHILYIKSDALIYIYIDRSFWAFRVLSDGNRDYGLSQEKCDTTVLIGYIRISSPLYLHSLIAFVCWFTSHSIFFSFM